MLHTIEVKTGKGQSLVDVTPQILQAIQSSGVEEGICVVFIPHTTAGLVLNSNVDPRTAEDINFEVDRLVPTRVDFLHTYDTPTDASGHIKTALVGNSQTLILQHGAPVFGHSQGVFLFEFDGPRKRKVLLKIIPG